MTEPLPHKPDLEGAKLVRIKKGCDSNELWGIHPDSRMDYEHIDNRLAWLVPWEDGFYESEVLEFRIGKGYYKEMVSLIFFGSGVCSTVPSRFLEPVVWEKA